MFSAYFFSGLGDFMQYLTSTVLILMHSADACILVMAYVDCACPCSYKPCLASIIKCIILITHLNKCIILQWHLGFFKYDYTPTKRGFDSFLGYWLGAGDYWDHSEAEGDKWGLDLRNNTEVSGHVK